MTFSNTSEIPMMIVRLAVCVALYVECGYYVTAINLDFFTGSQNCKSYESIFVFLLLI